MKRSGIRFMALAAIAVVAIFAIASYTSNLPSPPNSTSTSSSSMYSSSSTYSSSSSITSSSSTTQATSGSQVCTTTTVTDTNGNKATNDQCSVLRFIGLSTFVNGQKVYDSSTGKNGQITKSVTFALVASKPIQSATFLVGMNAYIGSTKIASNNTLLNLGNAISSFSPISLAISGLKLESYSNLFQNGGTLVYTVSGNETLRFTDNTLLLKGFFGNAGNMSLTFVGSNPTVTTSSDCGGCLLNPTASAYLVPLTGATTLTVAVQNCTLQTIYGSMCGAWAPGVGGSVSASYLCWDASKLTQPCSISPSSFSGKLDANSQYSFPITSVTLGSFNGYYLNSAGAVACCAPMYAPVGYLGSITLVTPFIDRLGNSQTSIPLQFVVASSPSSQVGGIVYVSPPCNWFYLPKLCS